MVHVPKPPEVSGVLMCEIRNHSFYTVRSISTTLLTSIRTTILTVFFCWFGVFPTSLQGEIACLESTALEEIEVESCLHRKWLTSYWSEMTERNIAKLKYHKISPFTFSDWQKTGRKLAEVLSCKLSAWLLKSGYFKGCVWLILCERSNRGDVWFQKCWNHQRSGVAFWFFQKMEIMRLPRRIFQTDLKQAKAQLTQRVFPKHFRTAQIAKRTKWSRSFGIMAPCGGLCRWSLVWHATSTASSVHQIHRKTMKHHQLLADTYRCHITATTHNKEAW